MKGKEQKKKSDKGKQLEAGTNDRGKCKSKIQTRGPLKQNFNHPRQGDKGKGSQLCKNARPSTTKLRNPKGKGQKSRKKRKKKKPKALRKGNDKGSRVVKELNKR